MCKFRNVCDVCPERLESILKQIIPDESALAQRTPTWVYYVLEITLGYGQTWMILCCEVILNKNVVVANLFFPFCKLSRINFINRSTTQNTNLAQARNTIWLKGIFLCKTQKYIFIVTSKEATKYPVFHFSTFSGGRSWHLGSGKFN